jgi:hypothetical protein
MAAAAFEICTFVRLGGVDSKCSSNKCVGRELGHRYGNKYVPRLARYIRRLTDEYLG